jgi:ATP-binding cassette subfamily B protein
VALARLYFAMEHGRRLLVLDEPTAHLDVLAETAFFDEFSAAARGASVLIISHRLATIRSADRIVLLADGRVLEDGTHEQLMARDGEYARLFRLQAEHFAVTADTTGPGGAS